MEHRVIDHETQLNRPVLLHCEDGVRLRGHLWPSPGKPAGRIVINPATGVLARYYHRYAAFLASHGFEVLTWDYRGVGLSRPADLRDCGYRWRDWGERDFTAGLAFMAGRDGGPLMVVGHSIGGFLPGLARGADRIDRMLTVGAQYAWWGDYAPRRRLPLLLKWHIAMPVLTVLCGYFPGRRLGWLEDLPAGVAYEWAFRRARFERSHPAAESLAAADPHCRVQFFLYAGSMTDLTIQLIAFTFLAAGIVKGVTGMGLPTLAMGVLGALLSPLTAASLLIVPSMVTNLWQLLAGPRIGALARRLWPMMAASMVGTLVAAPLLTGGNSGTATALGATLIAYALYTLFAPPFRVPQASEGWLSPVAGLVTGLIAGATGVFVIPAVPYLQALGLEKDDLVQALGMSFTISTIALALGLASRQIWQPDQLALSVLAVLPALIGMWAGQILRRAVSPATFRRWFLIMLAMLGAEMLLRGVV